VASFDATNEEKMKMNLIRIEKKNPWTRSVLRSAYGARKQLINDLFR
jgi:hypothetical protein